MKLSQSECSSTRFEMEFEGQTRTVHCMTVSESFFQYEFDESTGKTSSEEFLSAQLRGTLRSQLRSVFCELAEQARLCDTALLLMNFSMNSEMICSEIEMICRCVNPKLRVIRISFHSLTTDGISRTMMAHGHVSSSFSFKRQLEILLHLRFSRAFEPLFLEVARKYVKKRNFSLELDPFSLHALGLVCDHCQKHLYKETKYILNCCTRSDSEERNWKWKRKALFCKLSCFALYSHVMSLPDAKIVSVTDCEKIIPRPVPMNCTLLAHLSAKYLKMDAHMAIATAMGLYEKGLISYPLTSCQCFPDDFPFQLVFSGLVGYEPIARRAAILRSNFKFPEKGPRGFKTTIPIYPCQAPCDCSEIEENSSEMKLYDLIAKYFAACCMEPSVVSQTVVTLDVRGEEFYRKYKTEQQLNWLEVFDYASELVVKKESPPNLKVGDQLQIKSLKMVELVPKEKKTIPEHKLLKKMERFGLEAVMQVDNLVRQGLLRRVTEGVKPTQLGIAILYSFMSLGFDMSDPFLAEMTQNAVAEFEKDNPHKTEMLLRVYASIHRQLVQNLDMVKKCFGRAFNKLG